MHLSFDGHVSHVNYFMFKSLVPFETYSSEIT